jgi:hypothetical protein
VVDRYITLKRCLKTHCIVCGLSYRQTHVTVHWQAVLSTADNLLNRQVNVSFSRTDLLLNEIKQYEMGWESNTHGGGGSE